MTYIIAGIVGGWILRMAYDKAERHRCEQILLLAHLDLQEARSCVYRRGCLIEQKSPRVRSGASVGVSVKV